MTHHSNDERDARPDAISVALAFELGRQSVRSECSGAVKNVADACGVGVVQTPPLGEVLANMGQRDRAGASLGMFRKERSSLPGCATAPATTSRGQPRVSQSMAASMDRIVARMASPRQAHPAAIAPMPAPTSSSIGASMDKLIQRQRRAGRVPSGERV